MPGHERRVAGSAARPGGCPAVATAAGSAEGSEAALTVTGLDGCAAGWVAVTLGSSATSMVIGVTVAATLDLLPLAGITGIDIPLGLLRAGWREADLLARRALGGRGATVFAIPPRADDGTGIAIRY